jgi:hypothetical protein
MLFLILPESGSSEHSLLLAAVICVKNASLGELLDIILSMLQLDGDCQKQSPSPHQIFTAIWVKSVSDNMWTRFDTLKYNFHHNIKF